MRTADETSIERRVSESIHQYLVNSRDAEDVGQIQLFGTGAVHDLESKLCGFYGVKHALAVSNCTIGLLAVAMALGLRNKEVIVPPLVYGASLSGLLLLGNRLKFCDIDPVTLTLDADAVRHAISRHTKAILGVDIFGVPCDSIALRRVADEYGLSYISDSAQSFGATRRGKPSGYAADAVVLSFTAGKTLFAGEGGAILTDSKDLYHRLLWLTQHPNRQRKELGLQLCNEINLNGRIHPISAIWANSTFEESLKALRRWQSDCFELLNVVNEEQMTETIDFEERQINPTFFRITCSLTYGFEGRHLAEALRRRGFNIAIQAVSLIPIYVNGALRAQFANRVSGIDSCPVAQYQATRRLTLRFHQ